MPPLSSDGCVCRELKVATGEWFLEERSKRFEQGLPSSDVIKQTIMSTPCCEFGARSQTAAVVLSSVYRVTVFSSVLFDRLAADSKSTENLSLHDSETPDTPKSNRSAIRHVVDGARRRG